MLDLKGIHECFRPLSLCEIWQGLDVILKAILAGVAADL